MKQVKENIHTAKLDLEGAVGKMQASSEENRKKFNQKCSSLWSHAGLPPCDFVFPDFSVGRKGRYRRYKKVSHQFYTHPNGYKISVTVCSNNAGEDKGFISVFFYLMRGEFDDQLQWPFQGDITIQLLNQRGEGEQDCEYTVYFDDQTPYDTAARVRDDETADDGWGCERFISHDLLQPYMHNDRLVFRISEVTCTSV